jgi:isoamylase
MPLKKTGLSREPGSNEFRWEDLEGSPTPLGATWIPESNSFNFALYSKNAFEITLLAYGPHDFKKPVFTYRFNYLKNKTGRVWHARIPESELKGAVYYAYCVNGPAFSGGRFERHYFNPGKILLDPYARQVFFPPAYSRVAAIGNQENAGRAPLGVLLKDGRYFDWGSDPRPRHDHDLVIYEMHVGGFTRNPNSKVPTGRRGTFLGVINKIPYLKELGVTAVELMPVQQFDPTEPNYWGYMTLNFFSPHAAYATSQEPGEPIRQFQKMVKALHEADIEVILDVVYNHTSEGNETGPCFSFKGIDNSTYYMASEDEAHPYADYTGTGNTFHCANQAVQQLILDSLRYWIEEMHVDGFRFDLASVFTRNTDGSINFDDPPIFQEINLEPAFHNVRLIAEPWEGGAQSNYELGISPSHRSFPGNCWRQWNDRYRIEMKRFVKGDEGLVPSIMTRLYGSDDFFPDTLSQSYRAYQSLNYISSHDGLTLFDLTAYTKEGEQSWNCGWEGVARTPKSVMELRKRQVKNFICLLMLSNGTPMFRAGDEFLQTQWGLSNPYQINSPKTWLDWSRLKEHGDIYRFFQKMNGFRKSHPHVGRSIFWRDDVSWFGAGTTPDLNWESHSLAVHLKGRSGSEKDLYFMINSYWMPLRFHIQKAQAKDWRKVVDTAAESPGDFAEGSAAARLKSLDFTVGPRSVVVLERY